MGVKLRLISDELWVRVKTILFWLLLFLLLLRPNLFQYLFQILCHIHINFCYNYLEQGSTDHRTTGPIGPRISEFLALVRS